MHKETTAKSLSKMEIIRLYHDKRRKELWCKALGKPNYQDCLAVGGTSDYVAVSELKQGKYNLKKVPKLALEVLSVETIGNCFQVMLRDVHEDQILASMHPSCRDTVISKVRRGRIMILKDVAMFSIGGTG